APLANQIRIAELGLGAAFMHVHDEGTSAPQAERVFRVVAFRASTAIIENGIGVRSSMSKKTTVFPLALEQWQKLARPALAEPLDTKARPAEGEKAAG
ncbi:MAG: hypothetical protein ACAI25_15260, partial [Planctomycetota bacterium]